MLLWYGHLLEWQKKQTIIIILNNKQLLLLSNKMKILGRFEGFAKSKFELKTSKFIPSILLAICSLLYDIVLCHLRVIRWVFSIIQNYVMRSLKRFVIYGNMHKLMSGNIFKLVKMLLNIYNLIKSKNTVIKDIVIRICLSNFTWYSLT